MKLGDCFELGYIIKPHGTKGEVQVLLDVDNPEEYSEMESVFVAHGDNLVPFFINRLRLSGKGPVIKFEDIDTVEQANELRNKRLYLPLDLLPRLSEGQFYYHEIINFAVHDKTLGELGRVKEVFLNGHQDLIAMEYKGVEVLIPVSDEIVLNADRQNAILHVNLPEGLLDIYLS